MNDAKWKNISCWLCAPQHEITCSLEGIGVDRFHLARVQEAGVNVLSTEGSLSLGNAITAQ